MGEIDVSLLRTTFDTASWYSEWSTVAVAAGVFIELVALFIFSKEMPPLEKKVMVFATLLIVAGCVGEFIFGSRASDAAAQLQQASDRQVAGLKTETVRLSSEADTARGAIAEANARAKEADEKAEEEKTSRVRLEAEIAPRRLSPDKQAAIARSLSSFTGRTIRTESYGLDAEAAILAKQIEQAFSLVNIKIDEALMTRQSGGSIAFGVHVTGKDSDLVKALITSLEAVGIRSTPEEPFPQGGVSVMVSEQPTIPPDAIVFVGVKPINP